VRELASIVANPDALKALTEHDFAEAKRVLENDDPAITSRLFRRMKEMTEELEQARLDDIQRVRGKGGNPAAKKIALELDEALGRFLELCGIQRR
jgi:succinate dehydrogenase flavin-adding protein (antitoxin of CptAB toxin-antitoxin module)